MNTPYSTVRRALRLASLVGAPVWLLNACEKQQDASAAADSPVSIAVQVPPPVEATPDVPPGPAGPAEPVEALPAAIAVTAEPAAFDLNSIAASDTDLGEFPYFSAPEGAQYINGGGKEKNFERSQVAVDGKLMPVEGPWFGAYLGAKAGTPWSAHFVEKSYDDIITSLGGVRIFHGRVERTDVERVKALNQLTSSQGNFDYWNKDPISTYVIRRANGAAVYIQVQTNSASGRLQVAQQGKFEQTIQLVKASDLKKSLDANGKAVVHVNFDVDQATVQADGMRSVAEIVSLLHTEPALKLSIEGHTDTSGAPEHNRALSKNRADTVQQLLRLAGVAADRLKTQGWGDTQPVKPNTSDDKKAQNRRVELIKF